MRANGFSRGRTASQTCPPTFSKYTSTPSGVAALSSALKVGRAVVSAASKPSVAQVLDLVGAARDADRAGAEDPGQLSDRRPDRPAGGGDDDGLAGLGWPIWVSPT